MATLRAPRIASPAKPRDMTAKSELLTIFAGLVAERQDTAWQGSLAGFGLERLPLEIVTFRPPWLLM